MWPSVFGVYGCCWCACGLVGFEFVDTVEVGLMRCGFCACVAAVVVVVVSVGRVACLRVGWISSVWALDASASATSSVRLYSLDENRRRGMARMRNQKHSDHERVRGGPNWALCLDSKIRPVKKDEES